MEKLNELKLQLNERLKVLQESHKVLSQKFNKEFEDIIKKYTDKSIKVSINECSTKEFYFTIDFLDEKGNRIFATDIDGHYWNGTYVGEDSNKEYKLYFNTGCCGEFSYGYNEIQCYKYILLGELIKNASTIENELQTHTYNYLHNIKVEINKVETKLCQVEKEITNIKFKEIEKQLKVGIKYKYHNDDFNEFKIIKITKDYIHVVNTSVYKKDSKVVKHNKQIFINSIINGTIIVQLN